MKNEICCCISRISCTSEIYWFRECNSVFSILPTLEHLAQDRNFSCQCLCFHACFSSSKKPVRLLAGTSMTWSSSGELWCLKQRSLMFWPRYCELGLTHCPPWALKCAFSRSTVSSSTWIQELWEQAADSHTLSDSMQSSGNRSDDLCPTSAQGSQTNI